MLPAAQGRCFPWIESRPPRGGLVAECRLLKLGKRLAVGDVTIYSEGDDEPVAQATGTYSIPPPADV